MRQLLIALAIALGIAAAASTDDKKYGTDWDEVSRQAAEAQAQWRVENELYKLRQELRKERLARQRDLLYREWLDYAPPQKAPYSETTEQLIKEAEEITGGTDALIERAEKILAEGRERRRKLKEKK